MNNNYHRTIYNHTRGCLMAVAETAKSSGKAGGGARPRSKSKSKTTTCRKARSALCSGGMWLQASQGAGYSLPFLHIQYNSALSRKSSACFAASQLRTDPNLCFAKFRVSPQMFAAAQNSALTISPKAQIITGGSLTPTSPLFQNYWSQVASVGDINFNRALLDQDGFKGAPTPQIKVAYSGTYNYRTYRGEPWTHSFCDLGCDAPGDNRYYTASTYNSSFTTQGSITGTGASINNGARSSSSLASQGLNYAITTSANQNVTPSNTAITAPANAGSVPLSPLSALLTNIRVPSGGLFAPSTRAGATYLIEGNERLTNYKQWLSSDYLLSATQFDPALTQKRLGDGFYEQRLIRDQISQLTGKRFLDGFKDEENQYKALMDSAVTASKPFNLRPGVALTAEQAAQLTSDIVWLVETEVTLPNGAKARALAPQVYLSKLSSKNIRPDGNLIAAAGDIDLKDLKGFTNAGTLQAGKSLNLQTDGSLDNSFGTLSSGRMMTLAAGKDIDLTSSTVRASALTLNAGQDMILATATQKTSTGSGSRTVIGQTANIAVTGDTSITTGRNFNMAGATLATGGNLNVSTGVKNGQGSWNIGTVQANETKTTQRFGGTATSNFTTNQGSAVVVGGNTTANVKDLNVQGSNLSLGNGGDINASGNISLTAAKDIAIVDSSSSGSHGRASYAETTKSRDETVLGSSIAAGNNLTLTAKKDVTLLASTVELAKGAATIAAGGNVTIGTVDEVHKGASTHSGAYSGVVSGAQKDEAKTNAQTQTIGSGISAGAVNITAGTNDAVTGGKSNIVIAGSQVVADKDINLSATNNVTITAATSSFESTSYSREKTTGLMSNGGLSVSVGTREKTDKTDTSGTTQSDTRSMVGSTGGNLNINAGNKVTVTGSDLVTGTANATTGKIEGGGDVNVNAKSITIDAGADQQQSATVSTFKQSGVTAALSNPVLAAAQSAAGIAKAARSTSDGRAKGLAAVTSALQANNLANQVGDGKGGVDASKAGSVTGSVSVGSSSSEQTSTSTSNTASGSTVAASGSVNLKATGGGAESNLTVVGSNIQAGKNVNLEADNQVQLLASESNSESHSKNKSSSASIGISLGQQTGVTVAASAARGNADGSDTTFTNTNVNAGQTLNIKSGGDTKLIGAVATGQTTNVNVGGNLTVQSLQDTAKFDEKQRSAGGSVTIGPAAGGSVSLGKTDINSNYQSVGVQSGIKAGDGGFNVSLAGNTNLVGGAITSSQVAVDKGANTLSTATLTTSDLQNSASFKAESVGVTVGTVGGGGGVGSKSGEASSTTTSSISGATVTVGNTTSNTAKGEAFTDSSGKSVNTAARTGDKEAGIAKIFNAQEVKADVQAQVQITQAFGTQASKAVGDYGASKTKPIDDANTFKTLSAKDPNKLDGYEAKQLAELTKNGMTSDKADAALLDPKNQEDYNNWKEGGVMRIAAHAVVGSLTTGNVGGGIGAATSQTVVPLIGDALNKTDLPPALKSTLLQVAGIAVGAATGGTGGAIAGQNATANNYLKHDEALKMAALKDKRLVGKCDTACETEIKQLETTDKRRDQELAACSGVSSSSCDTTRQDVRTAAAEYIRKNTNSLGNAVYADEKSDTIGKARGTMDGKAQGYLTGAAVFVGNLATGVLSLGKLAMDGVASLAGNPDAQASWNQKTEAAGKFLGDSANWPQLVGALSPAEPEKLAQAYEKGDGKAVGEILGAQALNIVSNLPTGGLAGTVKTTGKLVDAAKVGERVDDIAAISKAGASSTLVPGGGLAVHEFLGGHTIERHLDMSQADLAARLAAEPNLTVASTFSNRASAEAAISNVLDTNTQKIQDFLSSNRSSLVVEGASLTPVGSSLLKGASELTPSSNVRVVLLKDSTSSTGYKILTGYPTP